MPTISELSQVSYSPAIYTADATQQVGRTTSVNNLVSGRPDGFRRNLHSSVQPAARPDEANLSSTGTLLARALQAPDVRLEKIAALQQSIRSGSYRVTASALADKMIGSLAS